VITSSISLTDLLLQIETILKINYNEDSVETVVSNAVRTLEDQYSVSLSEGIQRAVIVNPNTEMLCKDLLAALGKFSLYVFGSMYKRKIAFSLSDSRYLGYNKEQLLQALKYLQTEHPREQIADIISSLKVATSKLSNTEVKRLFVCLIVLYEINALEEMALLADALFLGGLT